MILDRVLDQCGLRRYPGLGWHIYRRFMEDGALNMASSLSYTSLLSLVPLMAIALAMLAAFPAFNEIRRQLEISAFTYFAPEVGEQFQRYFSSFVGNAGRLTAVGVVGLAVSAIMLLVTVETSLNRIFRVATARSPVSRILVYWTALTLGPLLLGASFSLSAWIYAAGDLVSRAGLSWLTGLLTRSLPNLLLLVSFLLLYMVVPHRRVAFRHAIVGALAAALAFGLLRWGFGFYIAGSHSYQSVYGALAAIPIFLVWTYLSWAVILFGAEITASLAEWRGRVPGAKGFPAQERRLGTALSILSVLLSQARRKGGGCRVDEMLRRVAEPEALILAVLDTLSRAGYAVATAKGHYVLGRDLGAVTLCDLLEALGIGFPVFAGGDRPGPWEEKVSTCLAQARETGGRHLDATLGDLLGEAKGGESR